MTKQKSAPKPSDELWDVKLSEVVGGRGLVMYNCDGKPVARYHLEDSGPTTPTNKS
jgi:hypothetical protein